MKNFFVFIFLIILLGAGCRPNFWPAQNSRALSPSPNANQNMSEQVTFETSDGVRIVSDYYAGQENGPVILLLHMRPASRALWRDFAGELVDNDFSALAIDLRGHGESVQTSDGRTLNYNQFSEAEEQQSIKDLEAAVTWLKQARGFTDNKIAIVGSSIGANLALEYLSQNNNIVAAVLLSPGLVYRGINTQDYLASVSQNQSIYYLAGSDDTYSALTVGALSEKTQAPYTKKIISGGGHGNNLLTGRPEISADIIKWLKNRFGGVRVD